MKLEKESFFKTEFGCELRDTVKAIDVNMIQQRKISEWKQPEEYSRLRAELDLLFAKWEVFKLAIKQFYGIEYNFTRTDEYFGVCTEDESDYLIKEERPMLHEEEAETADRSSYDSFMSRFMTVL